MAPRISGVTRASALGPIAEFMQRQGGSIARVLSDVDLPFALLEHRDLVVPLREQFRLLERAARETGDDYFGARLGQVVRSRELSRFGAWACSAPTLREAIRRAHAGMGVMLQTATVLRFTQNDEAALWSIEFVEPESEGRHHNELLGISYMIDAIRSYAGANWYPHTVFTALPKAERHAPLEDVFRCNVSHGHPVTAVSFSAALLDCPRSPTSHAEGEGAPEAELPRERDALATIGAVVDLALHEDYPRVDWVSAKMGLSRRSLQRLLGRNGTSFGEIVEQALCRRAIVRLGDRGTAITDIALELGYSDAAHFTRAFRRWTGMPPSAYRQSLA